MGKLEYVCLFLLGRLIACLFFFFSRNVGLFAPILFLAGCYFVDVFTQTWLFDGLYATYAFLFLFFVVIAHVLFVAGCRIVCGFNLFVYLH